MQMHKKALQARALEENMGRLEGKVAVILGAAGKDNMGQVMARAFAADGAKVVVGGRKEAPLQAIAQELGGTYSLCDITKKADIQALADQAVSAFGGCDIAVNCTGWGLMAPLLDTSEEQLDQMMALQFKGPYFFLQVFAGLMAEKGGGSIIQISSASATALLENHAAYIGTKAGTDAVVRCFANEFGAKGVKVNAIAPGLTATPMTEAAMQAPGLEDAFKREYPLGRIGTSEDIAHAAVWLASNESFVTGQVLQVNGGLTLRRNPNSGEVQAAIGKAMAKLQAKA
jgi:NAD(P)-dependent dehydrogenase (short-subunit alcohol dehydrogenase family)